MSELCEIPLFLKSSRKQGFLWISDVTRRQEHFPVFILEEKGYRCETDGGLLLIGFTDESWRILLAELHAGRFADSLESGLSFPRKAESMEYSEVYALASLLLCHPSDLLDTRMLSAAYQMTAMKAKEANVLAKKLLSENAVRLRKREKLCSEAGHLLSCLLFQEEKP